MAVGGICRLVGIRLYLVLIHLYDRNECNSLDMNMSLQIALESAMFNISVPLLPTSVAKL